MHNMLTMLAPVGALGAVPPQAPSCPSSGHGPDEEGGHLGADRSVLWVAAVQRPCHSRAQLSAPACGSGPQQGHVLLGIQVGTLIRNTEEVPERS